MLMKLAQGVLSDEQEGLDGCDEHYL